RGFVFSFILAFIAVLVAQLLPFLNSIMMGLLLGIVVGNLITLPAKYHAGISFTGSKILEIAVVLFAFGINYTHMAELGWQRFLAIVLVVFAVLLLTVYVSKKFNCPSSVGWLVGFGTAICGSSAIAALAPSIAKNKEDVGVAMAVVNLYGTLGMLVLPLVAAGLSLSNEDISMLLGGTLHAVGNVAGAGYAMSQDIGDQSLTIKLARVALLTPGLIFFNFITQRKAGKSLQSYFVLPWYLWGFLVITILVSVIQLPAEVIKFFSEAGKYLLTLAMVAIGLKVSFASLLQSGKRGLMFGLIIFLVQVVLVMLSFWI
ncbi:MAG: YeiH family protein, partial [Flavobacterium sp.]